MEGGGLKFKAVVLDNKNLCIAYRLWIKLEIFESMNTDIVKATTHMPLHGNPNFLFLLVVMLCWFVTLWSYCLFVGSLTGSLVFVVGGWFLLDC